MRLGKIQKKSTSKSAFNEKTYKKKALRFYKPASEQGDHVVSHLAQKHKPMTTITIGTRLRDQHSPNMRAVRRLRRAGVGRQHTTPQKRLKTPLI
jgi:predicted transcriptional regulator